ncbi:peptide ABC transporter substrate-binding protein [Opitutus sp. ER46]|uniref:peptide ABC transporter substrate-binding protein n=1 Tax=Opitutus sp. ER46 TaxID=2161864 RepID=UPI000D30F785|nr:peptide ABC transporter substrate-binding protein [Opitutus sp. ER46]PTX95669.1 peptide ABC transporter substrate-binding protein [Opitutus sp. ER46]
MRRLCLLASLLLLLLPAGCTRPDTPAAAGVKSRTLLVGNAAEPADLDPPTVTAYTDMNIVMALFEGLTFIDEQTTRPVPAAAERWETSADGLTWTFHLRPNAAWSNGDPLVADDFVQSFRRTVSPRLALENASYLFPLKNAAAINAGKIEDPAALGCRAADAHTLVLTLERPTPHLPLLTSLTYWYPINPRVLEKFDAMRNRGTPWTRPGNLVGNGPFTLAEWTPHARVAVVKNPRYWNAAATQLERIEFFPYEKADAEEHSFRAGQLHVTFSLPVSRIATWRKRDPAQLRVDPFLQTTFVSFNTKRPPFDDARVRRAFALAIDRAAISRTALGGSYAPAFAATPPDSGGYTARARVDYNPQEARALLAAAGHANGAGLPALSLQVRNDDLQPVVAEALQGMWQQTLGVHVELTPLEQKTWLQNQRTLNYSLSTFSWVGDYPDPLTFLGLFTGQSGNNWTGWSAPEYDQLIDTAATTTDAARRLELFQEAEAFLLETAPVTPVYHGAQTFLIHPAVRGWVPALLGSRRYQKVSLAPANE